MRSKSIIPLVILLFLSGCILPSSPSGLIERPCAISDLLIPVNILPQGTIADKIDYPNEGEESAIRSYRYENDYIFQETTRYLSRANAEGRFTSTEKSAFHQDEYHGPWNHPEDIKIESETADKYIFQCGKVGENNQCRLLSVYEEYFIYLRFDISTNGITYDVGSLLLKYIDIKMNTCLHIK